jgi:hypothetical protein
MARLVQNRPFAALKIRFDKLETADDCPKSTLVRAKRVESMGDQYCNAKNDQNAYNICPHKHSPRSLN